MRRISCCSVNSCIVSSAIIIFCTLPALLYLFYLNNGFNWMYCEGAPYIYVTYHDGLRSPLKYSRDGCLLSDNVVTGFVMKASSNLRSMLIDPDQGYLYVTEACEDQNEENHSRILVYGQCDPHGTRHFITVAVDQRYIKGTVHPYGLAMQQPANDLYVSYQHTDVILRFHNGGSFDYSPISLPPSISNKASQYYPGTFFQFGEAAVHSFRNDQGVRSIAFVGENLWITNENIDAIFVTNPDGYVIRQLQIRNPIGLYYSTDTDILFAGSKSSYGLVYAYNISTYEPIRRYYAFGMVHPTGLVTYQDNLFVAEQELGRIFSFDIRTGKLNNVLVSGLAPRRLEQLALSYC